MWKKNEVHSNESGGRALRTKVRRCAPKFLVRNASARLGLCAPQFFQVRRCAPKIIPSRALRTKHILSRALRTKHNLSRALRTKNLESKNVHKIALLQVYLGRKIWNDSNLVADTLFMAENIHNICMNSIDLFLMHTYFKMHFSVLVTWCLIYTYHSRIYCLIVLNTYVKVRTSNAHT